MTFCSYSLIIQDTKDHIPVELQRYFNLFEGQLSKPQQAHFQSWILGNLNGLAHGSKIAKYHSRKSPTSLTRFLSQSTWDEQELNNIRIKQSKQIVDQYLGKYVLYILDDSLCKKYGKQLPGAGYHWDHTDRRTAWGQHLVSSHMVLGSIDIPLFASVYLKKEQIAGDKSSRKFKSKLELAQDHIDQFPSFEGKVKGKTGVVIGDTWYGSKDVINKSLSQGYQAIFAVKRNRKIEIDRDNEEPLKIGKKIPTLEEKDFHLVTVESNTYQVWSSPVKMTGINQEYVTLLICQKLLFDKKTQESKWSDYFSLMATDLKMSERIILKLYEKRWKIETFYKFSKECLGFNKSQCRKIKTLLRFLILLFFSYTFLALSRCKNSSLFIASKSYYDAQSTLIDSCFEQIIIWVYIQATLGTPMNEIRLELGLLKKSA